MTNKTIEKFCVLCVAVGVVAPWFLLLLSAVISLVTSSEYWSSTAAYLVAVGLIWLSSVYLFAHLTNSGAYHQRNN